MSTNTGKSIENVVIIRHEFNFGTAKLQNFNLCKTHSRIFLLETSMYTLVMNTYIR